MTNTNIGTNNYRFTDPPGATVIRSNLVMDIINFTFLSIISVGSLITMLWVLLNIPETLAWAARNGVPDQPGESDGTVFLIILAFLGPPASLIITSIISKNILKRIRDKPVQLAITNDGIFIRSFYLKQGLPQGLPLGLGELCASLELRLPNGVIAVPWSIIKDVHTKTIRTSGRRNTRKTVVDIHIAPSKTISEFIIESDFRDDVKHSTIYPVDFYILSSPPAQPDSAFNNVWHREFISQSTVVLMRLLPPSDNTNNLYILRIQYFPYRITLTSPSKIVNLIKSHSNYAGELN